MVRRTCDTYEKKTARLNEVQGCMDISDISWRTKRTFERHLHSNGNISFGTANGFECESSLGSLIERSYK